LDGQPVNFLVKIGIDHIGHEQSIVMPYQWIGAAAVPDQESANGQNIEDDQEDN
jgi:hypothetical protein